MSWPRFGRGGSAFGASRIWFVVQGKMASLLGTALNIIAKSGKVFCHPAKYQDILKCMSIIIVTF